MDCPNCKSNKITEMKAKTRLGYRQYRCQDCRKQFNERTGTEFNFTQYPTDLILLAVFYYYHFKNSLVDVSVHLALRGFNICHETIHQWSQRFGTHLGIKFRNRRAGTFGKKWHIDITYLWVEGRWCYLYRAIDKNGNLVDVYLSQKRDKQAAINFFNNCRKISLDTPSQVTTDKEPAFADAIKQSLGKAVKHRTCQYMNNKIEQDHRGIKSRTGPMKGFKNFFSAMIFCHTFEEFRHFFKVRGPLSEYRGSLARKFHEMVAVA